MLIELMFHKFCIFSTKLLRVEIDKGIPKCKQNQLHYLKLKDFNNLYNIINKNVTLL